MTAEEYRRHPMISNSDLSEFKDKIFGIKKEKPVNAFALGSALHEVVLEKSTIIRENVDYNKVQKMAESLNNDSCFSWLKQFGSKEQNVFATHETTGLKLKARCDIVMKKNIVTDLKTTSERSFQAFINACYNYEYDRQMAFYHDVLSHDNKRNYDVIIVAVQKQSPYEVFVFEPDKNFINYGRKKYNKLLNEWKKQNYRPTSWGWDSLEIYQSENQKS